MMLSTSTGHSQGNFCSGYQLTEKEPETHWLLTTMGSTQKKEGSGWCCSVKCQLTAGKIFLYSSLQFYCPWKEHLGNITAGPRGYKLEGTAGEHELLRHFPRAIRHPKTDVLQSVRKAMAFRIEVVPISSPPVGEGRRAAGAVLEGGRERWRKTWSIFGRRCSTGEESHPSEGALEELLWPLAMCWRRRLMQNSHVYIRETLHDIQRPLGKITSGSRSGKAGLQIYKGQHGCLWALLFLSLLWTGKAFWIYVSVNPDTPADLFSVLTSVPGFSWFPNFWIPPPSHVFDTFPLRRLAIPLLEEGKFK